MKKQQAAIWLDSQDAFIIQLTGEEAQVTHIESNIDTGEVKGGTRTGGTPWGPQINVSENKHLERRKHEEKKYCEDIKEKVKAVDELYLFGPAEMKIKLEKALQEDQNFKPTILAVETADYMTQPQLIAKVKHFFAAIGNEN